MKRIWQVLMVAVLVLGLSEGLVFAQGPAETELALFEEIPIVITPGKKLQPITEAPASTYVVTQEDIKQSCSIHLWDALREVPGLDVVAQTVGQAEVSMRGFANLMTNKTLLMIDGRSIYLPIQGVLFWELLPVQLEEIDRVEVVKGPVASLYGANANLGLINVVTKTAQQMQGITYTSTGGSGSTNRHSLICAGTAGDLAYKFSGGWKETNSFDARDKDALDAGNINGILEYQIDDETKVALSGGITHADFYWITASTQIDNEWYFGPLDGTMSYVKADYQSGGFKARVYWNHEFETYKTAKRRTDATVDVTDGEISYSFDAGDKHALMVGAGGKLDHTETNLFLESDDKTHDQVIWDIFFQDEYQWLEKATLVSSVRLDHYPLTGYQPSGRFAALLNPNNDHLFRFSSGYGFRAPTISDHYMSYPVDVGGGVIQTTWGNKDVDPETYLTVEANYQGRLNEGKFRPFVDLFWTKIDDPIETYATGGGNAGLDQSWHNLGKVYSMGGELGAEYVISESLSLLGNYAFNHVQYKHDALKYFCPRHKINAGFKLGGLKDKLSAKLLIHYVEGTETSKQVNDGYENRSNSYVLANLWIGYKIGENMEVSVSGYNMLHDEHIETPGGDEIGTRALATVRVKF